MEKRKLQAWQPVDNLNLGEVYCSSLHYNNDGLEIIFKDNDNSQVRVIYNKISSAQDYVWTFRFSGEIQRSDISGLAVSARKRASNLNNTAHCFYKMHDSDYIEWFDSLPWLGSSDFPNVEHHVFPTINETIEVICDYEPIFIVE